MKKQIDINIEENTPEFIVVKLGDKIEAAKVVGCDRDYGISIVYANHQDDFVLCHKMIDISYDKGNSYCRMYDIIKKKIMEGYIDLVDLAGIAESIYGKEIGGNPSAAGCPFNE